MGISQISDQLTTFSYLLLVPCNSIYNKTFQLCQNSWLVPFGMSIESFSSSRTNNSGNTVTPSRINKNPVDWLVPRTTHSEINLYTPNRQQYIRHSSILLKKQDIKEQYTTPNSSISSSTRQWPLSRMLKQIIQRVIPILYLCWFTN